MVHRGTLSMTRVTTVSRTAKQQFFNNMQKTTSKMMLTSTWSGGWLPSRGVLTLHFYDNVALISKGSKDVATNCIEN